MNLDKKASPLGCTVYVTLAVIVVAIFDGNSPVWWFIGVPAAALGTYGVCSWLLNRETLHGSLQSHSPQAKTIGATVKSRPSGAQMVVGPYYGSKTLKRHFNLTEQLQTAPKSRQESIAEELVKMSVEARSEFLRLYPDSPLPNHRGFYRLAVNYERDKQFERAITICRVALAQEWNGDWEKRIERCEEKLEKMVNEPKSSRSIGL